jgi:hypothetical protein
MLSPQPGHFATQTVRCASTFSSCGILVSNYFHTALGNQGPDAFVSVFQIAAFFVGFNGTQAPLLDRCDGLANLDELELGISF